MRGMPDSIPSCHTASRPLSAVDDQRGTFVGGRELERRTDAETSQTLRQHLEGTPAN